MAFHIPIRIYVVCLVHPEAGTEPPYSAFTKFEDAQKYALEELPLDLGLSQSGLEEEEDFRIYEIELRK